MKLQQWLGLLTLAMAGYVLWQIRQLLLLAFLAMVIAVALNRLVQTLQAWGCQRRLALVLTLGGAGLLSMIFVALVVPPFWQQFQDLLTLMPQVASRLQALILSLQAQSQIWGLEQWWSGVASGQSLSALGAQLIGNTIAFFSNSFIASLQVLLVLALSVMFVLQPQAYRQLALQLFPSFYRRRANTILTLSELALGNWLTGIVINSVFIGVLSGLGLWALQIKLVLVHALMAAILNFIPNIGPAASVVFPLMIALLDSPWKIGAVLVLYFIIQNIESYWLTPIVMAKQVSLLPALTLIAQLFFASLFGLLGLVLALPLTVVAKTWLEEAILKDILDQWA